ncbi:MAG: ribosome silencing factor [Chloroflexi bacterium CG07_land_8_20_14_0_80_51_10]|nr:MAG: ribosome silencing factor [Chloroflexi bacterium CG07_land_8_20_14_0_80_51_10]
METAEIARKIVNAALNKQASDILLLDLRDVCSFTDYFVICNGESERQLQAICDEVDNMLAKERISPRRQQGSISSGWVILDLGNIIVHIFAPQQREFYALEDMWDKGSTVVKIL